MQLLAYGRGGGLKILYKGLKVENRGHRTQDETSVESGVESEVFR